MRQSCVTLQQILDARERRADLQLSLLQRREGCLLCLTMNIAGEVKRTPLIRLLFNEALRRFDLTGFPVKHRVVIDADTGVEAFLVIDAEAAEVKAAVEAIEDAFPAARLLDFDVLQASGEKLSRAVPRKCLICDAPAAVCARSRAHGLDALRDATDALLRAFAAQLLAGIAHRSLLDELYTTPKPGLVDRNNSGAHSDMDLPLFERSAESLIPYFREAVLLGLSGCNMAALRRAGLDAEAAMFSVTRGVNTHKGMIYSMGLLLAGMGKALISGGSAVELAAALAREDAEARLEQALAAPATNGARAYAVHGARGAQGEAAGGFAHGRLAARRLRDYRAQNFENPEALVLCELIATTEDTNLLHRGGSEGLLFAKERAKAILQRPVGEREAALLAMDDAMIRRHLSPGGSADLLAIGLLLEKWMEMEEGLFTIHAYG